jgi:hypothetical protein
MDYTIKMAGSGRQGDLEYWLGGVPWKRTNPQRNPLLGGNRQDPREFGRQKNRGEEMGCVPPWAKCWLRKGHAV